MSSAPEIPLDLRERMRECILALFWPKKMIIEFVRNAGAPDEVVPPTSELTRHGLVTEVFSRLSARQDRGHDIYQTLMDRLLSWSYFDPYYFDNLKKLDKGEAYKQLELLRRAIERRNDIALRRRAAAQSVQVHRNAETDLSALKSAFHRMFGADMTPQQRGRFFEEFLKELFRSQGVPMGDPFRLNGEQIDGSFKFEGENYIVEAKWQDPSTSTAQLYSFAHKVDGKMYGRGLFVSVNAYSRESITAVVQGKHIQTILVDGEDLSQVLEGRLSLKQMLDYKIRAAQTRGEVYVCSLRRETKI